MSGFKNIPVYVPVVVAGYTYNIEGVLSSTTNGSNVYDTIASSVTVNAGGNVGGGPKHGGAGGVYLQTTGPIHNYGTIHNNASETGGTLINGGKMGNMSFGVVAPAYVTNQKPGVMGNVSVHGATSAYGTVTNHGIMGGITIASGAVASGAVTNDGTVGLVSIYNYSGKTADVSGTVTNTGSLLHGVNIVGNGTVVSGSGADVSAYIGAQAISPSVGLTSGVVINYGTISADIVIPDGGSVTNGKNANGVALVRGGIRIGDLIGTQSVPLNETLLNYGTVVGIAVLGSPVSKASAPVGTGTLTNFGSLLGGASVIGGTITNGDGGLIERTGAAVQIQGEVGSVENHGTIQAQGDVKGDIGVVVGATAAGAQVINANLLESTIDGYIGVEVADTAGGGTVENYGTIVSSGNGIGSAGVILITGGTVVNGHSYGRPADSNPAVVAGSYVGIAVAYGVGGVDDAGTVQNYALITAFSAAAVSFAGAGFIVNGAYSIAGQATISGGMNGITAASKTDLLSVHNYGFIEAASLAAGAVGISMNGGGYIRNNAGVTYDAATQVTTDVQGTIFGYDAAIAASNVPVTIVNAGGVITQTGIGEKSGAAVVLSSGGSVTNSAGNFAVPDTNVAGVISGVGGISVNGGGGYINNYSTIVADTGAGVALAVGGRVLNGSVSDTKAMIYGGPIKGGLPNNYGVQFSGVFFVGPHGEPISLPGYVTNFGTITGRTGVFFADGGTVSNDSPSALIGNYYGVKITGDAGTIANLGSIEGSSDALSSFGVSLAAGGRVINGSNADRSASIGAEGGAVRIGGAAGTVANYATLSTPGFDAAVVYMTGGGNLTNGSAADTQAVIGHGRYGVDLKMPGTVTNFGTITSSFGNAAGANGVELVNGGSVVNGSPIDMVARISGRFDGVQAGMGSATISNYGTIIGYADADAYYLANGAVNLGEGGTLTNGNAVDTAALVQGYVGVYTGLKYAEIVNYGSIVATGDHAIVLAEKSDILIVEAGSTIVGTVEAKGSTLELAQAGTGTLSGLGTSFDNFGLIVVQTSAHWTLRGVNSIASGARMELDSPGTLSVVGTLDNAGTINEYSDPALDLPGSSVLVNQVGGTLDFNEDGSAAAGAASVIQNDGTIVKSGGSGTTTINSNVVDDGVIAVNSGTLQITGQLSGTGTVLAGTNVVMQLSGAVVGTGLTIRFTDPDTLIIDTPATFGSGVGTPGYAGPLIEGFNLGDVIELGGIGAGAAMNYDPTTGLMQISSGSVDATLAFQPGSFGGDKFEPTSGASGFSFTLACFAVGTRIGTPGGEVAVEALSVGDFVLTHDGVTAQPVVWVGYRRVDCHRHPRPRQVWPVRIRAGAFGDRVPHRDLLLSPDHAVYVSGVLIPIRHLVNGRSIVHEPCQEITYFHVELAHHEVLFAEGLPVESYLDTGNRSAFANGGGAVVLHPDFAAFRWEAEGCAPLVVAGPQLVAARQMVNARGGCGSARLPLASGENY